MKKKTLAFHFVGDTLRYGRPIPANGVWLEHTGEVSICNTGLHYSLDAFDALQYAPGATCCLVEIEDICDTQNDKGVCRRRKIIKRFDATEILRYFARMQALSAIHLWGENPPDVVMDFLMTGDESLRGAARDAAWGAARGAARGAAWGAAWDAARDAARGAARGAAWGAVWDAAWGAARDAARDAARGAARENQRIEFNSLINAEFASIGAV